MYFTPFIISVLKLIENNDEITFNKVLGKVLFNFNNHCKIINDFFF